QYRPTDPDHLWYSLSVVDWPAGDRDGQIKRVLDTTFEDANAALGHDSGPKDDEGDMRLIPMLEIEIPYYEADHYGNLPILAGAPELSASTPVTAWLDVSQTDGFQMSVRYKDDSAEPTVLVYVPATLVRDRDSNSPVAFSSRILYRPQDLDFGEVQTARLVWLVEAITDYCDVPEYMEDGPDLVDAWCASPANWKSNPARIIHSYYEDWYVTGMAAREDHGVDVAVIFEEADSPDRDPDYERYLWQVADSLGQTFVTGRSSGPTGSLMRDITISEIERRFDITSTATVEERWGIAPELEVLNVETFAFADQTMLAALAITHTERILDSYFLDGAGQPKVAAPTLLFAREERYRSASIETSLSGLVIDNSVSLSLDASSAYDEVLAGLNWAPYRWESATGWEPYPIDEYWAALGDTLAVVFSDVPGDGEGYENRGRVLISQNYYLALYHGVSAVVEAGTLVLDHTSDGVSDIWLSSRWLGVLNVPLVITRQIITGAIEAISKLPQRLVYFGTTGEKLL
ncbi:MAG: hypothetical protein MUQ30_16390, partial [Anaerolineae bacterium]|nr:hypothetical protein [Anaerolineae bacterium]